MPTARFRIGQFFIDIGEGILGVWNNTPREIVCVVDCMPFASGGTPARIEVVRTWNERRVGGIDAERRFFYELRNIGQSQAFVDVYMAHII